MARTLNDRERGPKWTTFEELLSAPTPKTIINEPVDFVADFAASDPQRESVTERAMRIWFQQKAAPIAEGG